MTEGQKLEISSKDQAVPRSIEWFREHYPTAMPEWQRRTAESLIRLFDKCGPSEEVRMVPYGRFGHFAWVIVKKGSK